MTWEVPSNSDDIIDARQIRSRIADLESERDDYVQTGMDEDARAIQDDLILEGRTESQLINDWETEYEDEAQELEILLAIEEEMGSAELLIRDTYFEDYARDLAYDIGAVDPKAEWPTNCIDWQQAADELQIDYTDIEFDGVTYWAR